MAIGIALGSDILGQAQPIRRRSKVPYLQAPMTRPSLAVSPVVRHFIITLVPGNLNETRAIQRAGAWLVLGFTPEPVYTKI